MEGWIPMGRKASVAVVGGGPAGSMVASRLAEAGTDVLLFEEKLGWEKPCGGGITTKALLQYSFLDDGITKCNWVQQCQITSPSGRQTCFDLASPVAVFSRRVLNSMLRDRTQSAGAILINERVVSIQGDSGKWELITASGRYPASFVVLAAGARSPLRAHFVQPFACNDLMMTVGYYIPGTYRRMEIRFVDGLHGYIWIFPRLDHLSAGICDKMGHTNTRDLRTLLDGELRRSGLEKDDTHFYAHILPSLSASTLSSQHICGPGWALVGDSAGFVDPITGEGLYYALRSADLLSESILEGLPKRYAERVRDDFLPELEIAAMMAERFFKGRWVGKGITERLVQFTAESRGFRSLMQDLFSGAQGYHDLRRRIYTTLPLLFAETLVKTLRLPGRISDRAA
jgi:flavin-dependent dehydrogenase